MRLALFALCTITAFAQLPPKLTTTVKLTYTPTPPAAQQMTDIVKTIGTVLDVEFNATNSSFTLHAWDNDLKLSAWLLHAVDKPANWQPDGSTQLDYDVPSGAIPVPPSERFARLHYLHNSNPRDAVEIVTIARVVGRVARVLKIDQPSMIAVRGTTTDADLADWLISKLDLPATADITPLQRGANTLTLPPPASGGDDLVRVYYLAATTNLSALLAVREKSRSATNTKTIFNKTAPPAIVLRGTSAQLAQADQIVSAL